MAIDIDAGIERREIERRRAVGGRQRIDRDQSFRRPVEAGRMIGGGAGVEIGRDRARGRAAALRRRRSRRARGLAAPPGWRGCRRRLPRRHFRRRRPRSNPPARRCAGACRRRSPDSGRSDQRVSAVTWNSTISPLPRRCAVTSGVPSASVAQVRSVSCESGSASTWRVTVTSFGTGMPANGPSREKPASCCGFSQLRLPPRMRPPRRSFTGTRSSSVAPARCGPAKRTSTPPLSIHLFELLARLGDIADIGEDQHRQMLVEEARRRLPPDRRLRRAGHRRTD